MKLKTLEIKNFKNIQNIMIEFPQNSGVTLLVGNNGCGKSNILEAISAIFSYLYERNDKDVSFDFIIEYETNNHTINVDFRNGKYGFTVDGNSITQEKFFGLSKEYLPKNIIACYSGENKRLWDSYYKSNFLNYIKKVVKSNTIPNLDLVYIDKECLSCALLTLFCYNFQEFKGIASFCNNYLGIKSIETITFRINSTKIRNWNDNAIITFIKNIANVDNTDKIPESVIITLDEFKSRLSYLEGREREIFTYLYVAYMSDKNAIIQKIEPLLKIRNDETIFIQDLSEGERKQILIRFILETLADENSLVLFDEPDSHIHVHNKCDFKTVADKFGNRASIWTTHSPTLASAFENQIIGVGLNEQNRVEVINRESAYLIAEITKGIWNVQQQNVFLASVKPISLLVEGETDKIIIQNAFNVLKADYPTLSFDVYQCNGADNIPQFMIGLKTSDISLNGKKIVAIFDSDSEGNHCCNKTQSKYTKSKNNKGLYAITLPKNNSTIENFFPDIYFNSAYSQAVKEHPFTGSVSDYSHKILNRANIILSENCINFPLDALDEFKKLFNLIKEISTI